MKLSSQRLPKKQSDSEKDSTGRLLIPFQVRQTERGYIAKRQVAANVRTKPNEEGVQPLVGLSLSGGGIRSATFSLGVLQSLAKSRLLRLADYLSTVSGGGYIGSCLTTLLTINPEASNPELEQRFKEDFDTSENMPLSGASPEQLHHLRTHGDFLIVRAGLFRLEFLRAVGSFLLGTFSSLLLFTTIMFAVVSLLMLVAMAIGGADFWEQVTVGRKLGIPVLPVPLDTNSIWLLITTIGAGCIVGAVWVLNEFRAGKSLNGRSNQLALVGIYAAMPLFVFTVMVFGFWFLDWLPDVPHKQLLAQFLPSVFCGASMVTVLFLSTLSRGSGTNSTPVNRTIDSSLASLSFYGLLISIVYAVFIWGIYFQPVSEGNWYLSSTASMAIVSLVIARLDRKRSDFQVRRSRWTSTIQKFVLAISVISLVVLLAFAIGNLLLLENPTLLVENLPIEFPVDAEVSTASQSKSTGNFPRHLILLAPVLLGSSVIFIVLGWLINLDRTSLHLFYRDRLAEAYLKTACKDSGTVLRNDSNIKLTNLHSASDLTDSCQPSVAPYHLIECAVNLSGSNDLIRKNRKSDVFVFSRDYSGSSATGYCETKKLEGGNVTLSKAMTISGAAASSGMGFYTSFFQSFLATIFNLRLGIWFPNPAFVGSCVASHLEEQRRTKSNPANTAKPKKNSKYRFWPKYLFKELVASTDAKLDLVNLSDGGHTGDNLGIYPLLQRRCRLIIVADGEKDPEYTFGSLINAIRMINIDENVQVEFDIDQIRQAIAPNSRMRMARQTARQPFAIGRIRYPATPITRNADVTTAKQLQEEAAAHSHHHADQDDLDCPDYPLDYEQHEGWIIYLKSSFTASDEPAGVKTYHATNPSFPHQSTSDQFFDDAQFEAYRLLGNHVVEKWYRQVVSDLANSGRPIDSTPSSMDLIEWAAKHWDSLNATNKPPNDESATAENH